eukprot:1227708-Pleurochrysis_carterae.AAC.4
MLIYETSTMRLQQQARNVLATVRAKIEELTTKDAPLEEVWRLAKRVKDNARKELKKVEPEKLSYEAARRRTPQRGDRGKETRAQHADRSVHLLKVAATEAFSQADSECSQACRAHSISKLQVPCPCLAARLACLDTCLPMHNFGHMHCWQKELYRAQKQCTDLRSAVAERHGMHHSKLGQAQMCVHMHFMPCEHRSTLRPLTTTTRTRTVMEAVEAKWA